jgi:hypothetical protein
MAPTVPVIAVHAGPAAVLGLQRSAGNRAVATALAPVAFPRGRSSPIASVLSGSGAANRPTITLQREPVVTVIDHGSGLSAKQLEFVVGEAREALNDTTSRAKDKALRKTGVTVRSRGSLDGVEALRKSGDILVYLVHGIKDEARRSTVVRAILTAEGALKGKRLEEAIKLVTGDLGQGQHVRDRTSDVAFINLDLIADRGPDSLRAIAGDILHEGIGHRAIEAPKGESTYHNPKQKGVMSETIRQQAKKGDIRFQEGEHQQVNKFLKKISDDPGWNKD